MIDMFEDMLQFQNETNAYLTDNAFGDWRMQNNKWDRAIWIECAELMEHYGNWKWWKGAKEPDIDQCFLECVDIWHFILSKILQQNSDVAIGALKDYWIQYLEGLGYEDTILDFHGSVEDLAYEAISEGPNIDQMLEAFSNVLTCLNKNFHDLYVWYLGKNTLNLFRNDHGYAENDYIKTWKVSYSSAREDNEHLAEILNSIDVNHFLSTDDMKKHIYQKLKDRYNVAILAIGIK